MPAKLSINFVFSQFKIVVGLKRGGIMKSMLLAFCCFCIATIAVAQEGAKSGSVVELLDILERILELNPDYDFEELSDYLEGIVDNPLDINTVSARELSRLSLLNDFQIESLLEYRRVYGHLRSVNELAVVPGFDYKLMKAISPLFKAVTNVRESSGRGFDNSYSARFRGRVTYPLSKGYDPITRDDYERAPSSRYLYSPGYYYGQIKFTHRGIYSGNLTIERDPGETSLDFISGSVEWKGKRFIKQIIVGDYQATFGEGLTLWNGFKMNTSLMSSPSQIRSVAGGYKRYTSAGEHSFYRGVAVSASIGRVNFNTSYSHRKLDGTVKDGSFTSLYKDGIHNTAPLLERKGAIGESLFSFNTGISGDKYEAGYTFCAYMYDLKDNRRRRADNIASFYDGAFWNMGIDYSYIYKRVRFFGEFSIDARLYPAFIGGVIVDKGSSVSHSLLLRVYSSNYNASHGSALGSSGDPNNEYGLKYVSRIGGYGKNIFTSYLDIAYMPGPGYNISPGFYRCKIGLSHSIKMSKRFIAESYFTLNSGRDVPFKLSLRETITFDYEGYLRVRARGEVARSGSGPSSGSGDGVGVGVGWLLFGELRATPSRNLSLLCRASIFDAQKWGSRLYMSENDPFSGGYPSLIYGRGYRWYFMSSAKILRWCTFSIKVSQVRYSDRDKIGEGPQQIDGPSVWDIKTQMLIRL